MDTIHNQRTQVDNTLETWRNHEKLALELIQKAGDLRFDNSIELVLFRKDVYDSRPSNLINYHNRANNFGTAIITIEDTMAIVNEIAKLNIKRAKIDIGLLALDWKKNEMNFPDLASFLNNTFDTNEENGDDLTSKDVVLYGFGRIGRLLARRIITQTGKGEQLRLKAIVLRPQMKDNKLDAEKRAALLSSDSVHGEFGGSVAVSDDGSELIVNGNRVKLIYAANPEDIDYTNYGIKEAIVIDNTGVFRDKEALGRHLRPGVSHVILTAPGKKIPNIVYGVNQNSLNLEEDKILCAASCTTNAIVPVIKVIDDAYTLEKGHVETIHAYTSDQNLLDNFHKKPRRGRAAALNMVITSTGAAEAISSVLPHLDGKITGNAVRVPTPNVSLAIINVTVSRQVTIEEVNQLLKDASTHGELADQMQFSTSDEYVSTNAIGMTSACVIDGPSTLLSNDGRTLTLYVWYDNEHGYSCQVVRVAKHVGKVRRKTNY